MLEGRDAGPVGGLIQGELEDDWLRRGLDPDPEAVREARHLEYFIEHLFDEPLWDKSHESEVMLEAPLSPEVTVFGRLDRVVTVRGKLRHLQWKTLAAGTPWDVFSRVKQRSLHEGIYNFLGQVRYGDRFEGTLLVGLKKIAHHARVAGQVCHYCGEKGYQVRPWTEGVLWSDLLIDQARVRRACQTVLDLAIQMDKERQRILEWKKQGGAGVIPIEQREKACGGPYGNRLCEFIDSCDGFTDLWDPFIYEDNDPLASYKEGN